MKRLLSDLLFLLLFVSCSSSEKSMVLDTGTTIEPNKCSSQSFLNLFAHYKCSTLDLEDNNNFLNESTPIHNKSTVVVKGSQKLLIVGEKLFGAALRSSDLEPVCLRRLKVILNPGTGRGQHYQVGWITYRPQCLKFIGMTPPTGKVLASPLMARRLDSSLYF